MNKIKNTNKGITLIALVITIIVMLILVAVIISMAVNGGLFDYAGKAVGDTQNAIDAEQELGNGKIKIDGKWYNNIDDYIAGKPIEDESGDVEGGEEEPPVGEEPTEPPAGDETIELPEGIKVGDYVNYEPTAGEYEVSSTVTGSTDITEQTFATETGDNALKWRILSIDEETGKVELVAATAAQTSTKLHLKGADGYNHAVDVLNDLCEELYSKENSKGERVATARSIKIEDINKKTTYDYTTYTNYGTVFTPSNTQYPNIYTAEEGSTAEALNGTGLKGSEGVRNADGTADYTTYTGLSTADTLYATYTFYRYIPESFLKDLGVNTAPTGLLNVGTSYWLASRCVDRGYSSSVNDWASYCVRYMYSDGTVYKFQSVSSGGVGDGLSLSVRPVVSLESNVTLTKDVNNQDTTKTVWNVGF